MTATLARALRAAAATLLLASLARADATPITVDDFENVSAWSSHPAEGVALDLHSDSGAHGNALRLDFRFEAGAGYAVARRAVDLTLPDNYEFRFAVRGECRPNDLEFKLIDSTGANVWWCNRRRFEFPKQWTTLVTRKRHISFAWGPIGGGDIRRVKAIEIAITAGEGGTGSVWLDDFTLRPLPPPSATPPPVVAHGSSTADRSRAAGRAVDGDTRTSWRSAASDRAPWLDLGLGGDRELSGLRIEWANGGAPADYAIEASDDGKEWREIRRVTGGDGGVDELYLPETETRRLRVRALGTTKRAIEVREIVVHPIEWAATPAAFFEALAKEAPRGDYPRALTGQSTWWAVVGDDAGGTDEGLLGEDGALETGKGKFSIEPFLGTGGRLVTWADFQSTSSLVDGDLPLPVVHGEANGLSLEASAFAVRAGVGPAASRLAAAVGGETVLAARYRVTNHADSARRVTLYLALRPFQVNPPFQALNMPLATAPIHRIEGDARSASVDSIRVLSLTPATAFGASSYDAGNIVTALRQGRLPATSRVNDAFGYAAGAWAYTLDLPPGGTRDVAIALPFRPGRAPAGAGMTPASADRFDRALDEARREWRTHADRVAISLPDSAREVEQTLRAQIGWILANRDGPAIQPGSRTYERSWIRDGSLTSSALLALGHPEVVREFVEWFAAHQFPDGRVPCCIDRRGADPVPEHDSHGELIFAVAEYVRVTGDRAFAERMWPHVANAVAALDTLRAERRTAEWRTARNRPYYGLLPPSISHEGYSAKPMHSYWDDFFALQGYDDAVELAKTLGRPEREVIARSRDEFRHDLAASLRAAIAAHHIDYVPGCADLGDFDATSTTIALSPTSGRSVAPPGALERTFERYWSFFRDRRDGRAPWDAYTPYELRNVGAFVRLGWRERANELLDFFMAGRRPPGWRQWPEVVWHDERAPRFLGDLPHTWVGSDFARSVLDMLAYRRDRDQALVIAAGAPLAWTRQRGIAVHGLRTAYGPLSYTLHTTDAATDIAIESGLRVPPGGIVVAPPLPRKPRRATVDGATVAIDARGMLTVRRVPAYVRIEY